ncbi:MAG: hypothetical protein IPK16_25600 [Anaerolineales bacterium]|nr:hypothetical protein [Anaerolineales bacterium]
MSVYDKRHGIEWLTQPVIAPTASIPAGSDWDGERSYGWDEMMPTIIACPYPGPGNATGAALPDHGEIWTAPWQVDATRNTITVRAKGRAVPYSFQRSATLETPDVLVLQYTVENTGDAPLVYLWAAHPLFACEPGSEVLLPPAVDAVVSVLPLEWGPQWGPPDTVNPWPAKNGGSGMLHLNRVGDIQNRSGRKFYVLPDEPVAWAALWRPAVQGWLQMRWDPADSPYLGIWIDEGASYPASGVVALEPSNGYYDNLALAAARNRAATLAPGAKQSWQVTVRTGGKTELPSSIVLALQFRSHHRQRRPNWRKIIPGGTRRLARHAASQKLETHPY